MPTELEGISFIFELDTDPGNEVTPDQIVVVNGVQIFKISTVEYKLKSQATTDTGPEGQPSEITIILELV